MLVQVALVGALLALAAWLYVRRQYGYFAAHGIPFAAHQFPYGSIKGVMQTEHMADILGRIYTQFKGRTPLVGLWFMLRRTVLAVDLDFIKTVLVRDFSSFENRGVYYNERDDPLSAHLFSIEATLWRRIRSKLTPTFTSGKMRFMYQTITQVAEQFRDVMSAEVRKGRPLEMKELLGRFTVDVIGSTAFGIECKCLSNPEAEFLHMGRKIFNTPRHHPLVTFTVECFPRAARWLGIKAMPDDVGEFFLNIVRQTVEYRESDAFAQTGEQRNDFIDLLIKLKNEPSADRLSLEEIAAQAFVFFIAGFETSATTMTFALYELAVNPDVQERVRVEVEEVLKRHGGEFTYEAMMEMTYLEQTINETLRKYPPVPALTRQTSRPYHVADLNFTIPANIQVWIPALAIHMDPEFWPEPQRFDPDRFEAAAVRERNPLTFLPFGDGPRNCIGLRFGMMQVRVGLVTLLRSFRFAIAEGKTTHPIEIAKTEFILAPVGGMWLDVQPLTTVE